jgi:hypothetical protein
MTVAPFRYFGVVMLADVGLHRVRTKLLGVWVGVVAAACGASPTPRPARAPVELSETLPSGYESLGDASAACRERPAGGTLKGVPATSFACSQLELERALVEQANARGGSLLAGERCHWAVETGLVCSAQIGRSMHGVPGSTVSNVTDDDGLTVTVASRIRIDLEASGVKFERRPRGPADVTEFAALPVGHVELGVMRARCRPKDCDADEARAGLRLAAGGLGVSDLVGVRCFSLDGERACVGTLGVMERDPETDPRAR